VFSLGGRKLGSVGSGERIVKYTTGHSIGDNRDDDLEDIAIVSNTDLGEVTYGGGQAPNYSQANGPRLVPGETFSSLSCQSVNLPLIYSQAVEC
jgi:hypothetical protein